MVDGQLIGAPLGFPETSLPTRAVLPVFDDVNGTAPDLAYKIEVDDVAASITILGEGLTGITGVDVMDDVNAAGNAGDPPVVGTLVVTDTSITVPLDATDTAADDFWGVVLSDAAGNEYRSPSPLKIEDTP